MSIESRLPNHLEHFINEQPPKATDISQVKKLYISGPMTGYDNFNTPAFEQATQELQEAGYEVFSPHHVTSRPGWEWSDYMRADLVGMLGTQGVATLDGWQESRGATCEVTLAQTLGMFVLQKGLWISMAQSSQHKDTA